MGPERARGWGLDTVYGEQTVGISFAPAAPQADISTFATLSDTQEFSALPTISDEPAPRPRATRKTPPRERVHPPFGPENTPSQHPTRAFVGGADAAAPAPRPRAFEERYRLGEILGHGGAAFVRAAYDVSLRRHVAVKTLSGRLTEEKVLRFVEEAQIASQLDHPNIVPVHEMGFDGGGRPYLVMRRVNGRSLGAVLDGVRAGKPTGLGPSSETPGEALRRLLGVFIKVCDGVAYAHGRRVIHRDLKPANVMVGEFGEVLVMDWGLAKFIGRPDTSADHRVNTDRLSAAAWGAETGEGQVVGTLAYMPPEQAMGKVHSLDERSDIWSLGAILYEIAALEQPFEAGGKSSLQCRVMGGVYDPPSRTSRAPWPIPAEIEAIVLRAMAPLPEDRYATVARLRADVEAYLAATPLGAARAPAARPARARRLAWLGAVAAVFLFAGGVLGGLALFRIADASADALGVSSGALDASGR